MNPTLKEGRILALDRIDGDGVPVFKTNANVQPGVQTWTPATGIGQCWYFQVGIKYLFN